MATPYEPPIAKAAQNMRAQLDRLGYQYVQPPWEEAFAAKGPFLLAIQCDPRDRAWVTFGRQVTDVDRRFFPSGIKWDLQRPFEAWLEDAGKSSEPFVEALGGWVTGGIQGPNFARLGELILEHLTDIERHASR
jgi:hypothetical protein